MRGKPSGNLKLVAVPEDDPRLYLPISPERVEDCFRWDVDMIHKCRICGQNPDLFRTMALELYYEHAAKHLLYELQALGPKQ